jgi:predicted Zn-dependent protease
MRRLRRPAACLVGVTLLVSACAGHIVPPIGAGGQPFEPEADERALWARAEKEEEALLKKARRYDDPQLEEYLGRIAERVTPDEVRAAGGPGFTVTVLRDPTLSAFAMPDGNVFVHTGLLSRLDNEAQLATIIGHETTHVIRRHALIAERKGARAEEATGAAVLGPTAKVILGLGLPLAALASIDGYGRDLEAEADAGGLASIVKAGYDPKEAPKAFDRLRSDSRDRGSLETFLFGSERNLSERAVTVRELIAARYAAAAAAPATVRDSEEFQLRMRTVVRDNAYEDIRAGRFTLAQRQLDRVLAVTPQDPLAYVYYGDLHRLQAQRTRDVAEKAQAAVRALAAYERAAALDPTLAEPYRQLGFLYYEQKQTARAREAFAKYLALKPDAADARRIKEYLTELDR